jgi:hypothetical protein
MSSSLKKALEAVDRKITSTDLKIMKVRKEINELDYESEYCARAMKKLVDSGEYWHSDGHRMYKKYKRKYEQNKLKRKKKVAKLNALARYRQELINYRYRVTRRA